MRMQRRVHRYATIIIIIVIINIIIIIINNNIITVVVIRNVTCATGLKIEFIKN